MNIHIATSNPGKLRDFSHALTPGHTLALLPGIATMPAPDETADSFEGNARIKAEAYSRMAPGLYVLADDSGIEADALGGAPGVRSARFADDCSFTTDQPLATDARNNLCLLNALAAVSTAPRTGRYRCVLALARNGKVLVTASGSVEGEILTDARGNGGFGYDPLFLLPDAGLTMAEIATEMRQRYSHRARALAVLLDTIDKAKGSF
jgi:XTP/dITP diphosphohydrolase